MREMKYAGPTRAAVLFALMLGVALPVHAAWESYDKFNDLPNNSPPDDALWKVTNPDSVANVFINKKKLVIDFLATRTGEVGLELVKKRASIRGVRMDVKYKGTCSNGEGMFASALIGTKTNGGVGIAFLSLFARSTPNTPNLQGLGYLAKKGSLEPLFAPVTARKTLIGKTVPATMRWNRKSVKFKVAKKLEETRRSRISLKRLKKSQRRVAIAAGRETGLPDACRIVIDNVEVKRAN